MNNQSQLHDPSSNSWGSDLHTLQTLNSASESICLAKWYNATIWLGSGMTTSCHHPPAHKIDVEAIKTNPSAIHNTAQKKQERQMMQAGEKPSGCEYCWKIESIGPTAISDRVYKSKIYPIQDLNTVSQLDHTQDVNLKTLEISFDRTCQFACSYCNPAFSSTWAKDIKNNGAYENLISDGRNHFTHEHKSSQLYRINKVNPYVEAFFKWWESDLHNTLQELRVTGGEPLMSGYTWKLIDWFRDNPGRSQTRLAVNSNLGMEYATVKRLLDSCQDIELDIYTSNESVGVQAEYIRDGLNWRTWTNNMVGIMESGQVRALHVMCTINALCLDTLVEFLDLMLAWKDQHGADFPSFTLNILRFPSFQSALVLPAYIKQRYCDQLQAWHEKNKDNILLHQHEKNHVLRLIDYLTVVDTPHSEAFESDKLLNDFGQFYRQYDSRRNKSFINSFPNLAEWYESIQV